MPTVESRAEPTKQSAVQSTAPAEAPAPVVETVLPKEEIKQPERVTPQFAALARKEKALRLEAQKIKLERESIKAEQEKLKSSDYIPKARLNSEFMQVLAEAGITPDQAANFLLNNPQGKSGPDPLVAKLMARIEELESKTTKVETDFKDNQSKQYEQAVNQVRNKVKLLVDSDPMYETIKSENRSEDVVKHIQKTFEEEGVLLSEEQAAKEVEDELVALAMRLSKLNKIKSQAEPPAATEPQPKAQPHTARTLTHDMTSAPKPKLSAKDRYQRAVLRASGLDPDTGKPFAG